MKAPIPLTAARRARDAARSAVRFIQLRQGLNSLTRTLHAGRKPEATTMRQLVRGWGNEAWSADAAFLSIMLDWLSKTSGAVIECGSGLSTMLLASACELTGRGVFSLEHTEDWASVVERRMPARLKQHVRIIVAPLRSYGDFDWYSVEGAPLPDSVGFVVCDGPPGTTRGGRYGLGPILAKRLTPGAIILLDDTQRADDRAIAGRWCAELGAAVVQEGETFTILRTGSGHQRN